MFVSCFNRNRFDVMNGDKFEWKEVVEFFFDSDVKCMSVIMEYIIMNEYWVFIKGVVERVIGVCIWYCDSDVVDGESFEVEMIDEFC